MFAVITGESGAPSNAISLMASALPGSGTQYGCWVDKNGSVSVAAKPTEMLPEDHPEEQPFVEPDLIFVCRVRLDDRNDLLRLLEIDQREGAALSDSAILRLSYRKWREDTPRYVYGDFAFAAWERSEQRLVAATDHLGTYPLFYSMQGERMLVATQLSALMANPATRRSLDIRTLGLFLAPKLSQGRTMFEGLHQLPGGEKLIFSAGALNTARWWKPDTTARIFHSRAQGYVEEIRALFEAAVSTRLRTRGSVAATMSGGLDSTLVASMAAVKSGPGGQFVEAFTAVPEPGMVTDCNPGWDPDDTPWAAAVAAMHTNMRHHMISPDGLRPFDISPKLHAISRTPILNTANGVWVWRISELAANCGAKVILSGERGNVSFSYAGSDTDAGLLSAVRIAGLGRRIWEGINRGQLGTRTAARFQNALKAGAQTPKLRPGAQLLLPQLQEAYREQLQRRQFSADLRMAYAGAATKPLPAERIDYMAHFGLEWRDPTGDRRLIERLLAFPLHAFLAGNRSRGLAREIGRGLLPESVRLRRSRGDQSPDQAAWFAARPNDYRRVFRTVQNSLACRQFLDMTQLEAELEALCAGTGSADQAKIVHRALDIGLFAASFENGLLCQEAA